MVKVQRDPQAFAKLKKAINDVHGNQLRVGFFDTAKYEDGTPVAYVATIHEFGAPAQGIPPRPFMRPVIAENRDRWAKTLEGGARRVLGGNMDTSQMLGQVGMMVAGEIAQGIASVTEPALSESTIASRKRARKSPGVSRKPLVDTGLMIQSVSSKVENV